MLWLPDSGLWISIIWLVFFAVGAIKPGKKWRRLACINLAALAFVIAALELSFSFDPVVRSEGSRLAGYSTPHEVLGYGAPKSYETTYRRYSDDTLVYDVTYSTDEHGLRVPPRIGDPNEAHCVLFFGGSFTFGEGLENEEAMPYRVGLLGQGRLRVYNFAYHGYGPHQMLAALELGPRLGGSALQDRI